MEPVTRREALGGGLVAALTSAISVLVERLTHEDMVPLSYVREQTNIWIEALRKCQEGDR